MQSKDIDKTKAFEAFATAQGQFKPAIKDASNPYFKSKYADLSSIWEAVSQALSDNGLMVFQPIRTTEAGSFLIETIIRYKDGTVIEQCECPVIAKTQNDPQALGSAITYARRYSLASILCIVTDDDDAEAATNRPANQAAPARNPQAQSPAQPPAAEQAKPKAPTKLQVADASKALDNWHKELGILNDDPQRRQNPEAWQVSATVLKNLAQVDDKEKIALFEGMKILAFEHGIDWNKDTKKFYLAEPVNGTDQEQALSLALADNG